MLLIEKSAMEPFFQNLMLKTISNILGFAFIDAFKKNK